MSTPEVRPRGTRLPRTARRSQLLGAAREVFVAQGYHAAAMDEIAERAGVSKPVLYQHFPGKHELYVALIDQHAAEVVEAVRAGLGSTTNNKLRGVCARLGSIARSSRSAPMPTASRRLIPRASSSPARRIR